MEELHRHDSMAEGIGAIFLTLDLSLLSSDDHDQTSLVKTHSQNNDPTV